MSARSLLLLGSLSLLLPLTVACNRSSQSSQADGTVLESSQAGDRSKSGRVLAGQLRSVDPDRETLIVAFGDDLYEFAYTDATEVVAVGGTANVQGLTGNTGNQITVHYRQNPITSTKTAVRIELQ
jgi:hypothetical protein